LWDLETQKKNIQIQDIMFGFDTINEIAKKTQIQMTRKKFDAIYGDGYIKRRKSTSYKTANVYEFKRNSSKKIQRFF